MKDLFTKRNRYLYLFAFLSLSGSFLFFAYAFLAGASAYDWAAMENNGKFQFGDYFMHVAYVADRRHLYSRATGAGGCFPPLVYMMYYFLYRITKSPGVIPANRLEAEHTVYAMPVFMYYTIFVSMVLFFAIYIWNKQLKNSLILFVCLMLSIPFYEGGIERGNSTVLVMAILLIALKLKDSSVIIHRKIAMFLIAVCAGFKIYPAVFGLLYLKEKRYKEAVWLVLCGIVLFFAPFSLFGGYKGFRLWLKNVLDTMGRSDLRRIQYIKGVTRFIFDIIFKTEMPSITSLVPFVFLLIMIMLAWISVTRFRELFFLCAIMTFFPTNAYRYTLCYLAIPLIILLSGNLLDKISILNTTVIFIYGLLFSIPMFWGALTSFRLSFPYGKDVVLYDTLTYVEFWIYLMAYLLLGIITIHELFICFTTKTRR